MATRWVAVTGASSGIGRATVDGLERAGFGVLAGVLCPAEAGVFSDRAGVRTFVVDLAGPGSIDEAAATIRSIAGPGLFGLVNNAGIAVVGPTESLPDDQLRRQFEVNFFGAVHLTRSLLPTLVESRGRVVNMSSMFGKMSLPFGWPYCASKHALDAWTSGLRMELCRSGARVITIRPGSVRTAIWSNALANLDALFWGLPAESRIKYFKMLERQVRIGQRNGERGIAPERVAATVVRAISSRDPRALYSVGPDAIGYGLLQRLLGDRAMERLTTWRLHAGRTEGATDS